MARTRKKTDFNVQEAAEFVCSVLQAGTGELLSHGDLFVMIRISDGEMFRMRKELVDYLLEHQLIHTDGPDTVH